MANVEVPTENLLNAVVRMPAKEFARFLKNAKQIKDREASLIAKIKKFNFSPEKEKLYRQLLKKFRAEKIERLKCLAEIAEIRNSTLDDIVRDLKIKPKNYG
jgi:arginyl-tRNA--protein-N-Asp/Glu arginylyltransferase